MLWDLQPTASYRYRGKGTKFADAVGDVIDIVTVVVRSIGRTLALLEDSAGVGAVELLAVSRQRVVDQMVDNGWIKKSLLFTA